MFRFIILLLSCIVITQSLPSKNIFFPQYRKNSEIKPSFELIDNIQYANITQKVDHFNPMDTRTFELPYAINDAYFKPNGPIFIQSPYEIYLQYGHMSELGREFGAYMIAPGIRFYDVTPNGKDNTTMANLQYNTFEQKIADFVHLIKTLKSEERFSQSKVIFFGCSEISGQIATWIRLENSDIVDGAVASSAPVNLKAGSPEFFENISNEIINEEGQGCRDIINAGFQETLQLIARNESEQFEKIFDLCGPQSFKLEDISMFIMNELITPFVMNSYNACPLLNVIPGSPIDKISDFIKRKNDNNCLSPVKFDDYIKDLQENGSLAFIRPDLYTQCKEAGAIPVSVSSDMLFAESFPLSLVTDFYCPRIFDSSLFGENMIKSIESANQKYGGLTPNVTKVVSVHGARDVNKLLGITKDLNPESPAIVIDRELACADTNPFLPTDRPELKAARQKIRELVMQWIQ